MSKEKTRPNVRVRIENHKKVKTAHNAAAEAHLKAADAQSEAITNGALDTVAAQKACLLSSEALARSEAAFYVEQTLFGKVSSIGYEALDEAKSASNETSAATAADLHRDAHEHHEATFRGHAVLENEAQVQRHQRLVDKAMDDVNVNAALIEE